ncbi:MAG: hypothetical protein SFU83_19825 [Meiothermus sp.]|nr:hypothetical protein [Meiothermus sp.]
MTWADLPRPWVPVWEYAEQVLVVYNDKAAHALRITVDGAEVYPRLLIPSKANLESEARLWPHLTVTQTELYRAAIERLAVQHPIPREVVVSLVWGGIGGVKVKPAYTFRNANERAA